MPQRRRLGQEWIKLITNLAGALLNQISLGCRKRAIRDTHFQTWACSGADSGSSTLCLLEAGGWVALVKSSGTWLSHLGHLGSHLLSITYIKHRVHAPITNINCPDTIVSDPSSKESSTFFSEESSLRSSPPPQTLMKPSTTQMLQFEVWVGKTPSPRLEIGSPPHSLT